MKAAVCYAYGQPLVVEEVEVDEPHEGEVKVRLAATAICHSDVHLIRGEWRGEPPIVAGHEAAGVVEAIGAGVTLTQPGDHVVVSLLRSCGRCFHCRLGAPHQCEGRFALQTESRLRNRSGEPLRQGANTAAFAEYVVVDQSQAIAVPADMPLDRAALLACGVSTGVGAVTNTAQVAPGSSVVVIGAGGVGLNATQGAVLAGAHPIVVVDLLDAKLDAARTFGATHTVNPQQHDARATIKALTGGRGADYVFVTVGSGAAIEQAFRLIRALGTVVIVGIPPSGTKAALSVEGFVLRGQRIIGSFMGSGRPHVDIPRYVELYRAGRLKLDELITARYPLERINEAIAAMESGAALRNVIVFDQTT
jgi:S-(hydroxymethyl)glutathione dehydrogenase / alcohol dehydrogenase